MIHKEAELTLTNFSLFHDLGLPVPSFLQLACKHTSLPYYNARNLYSIILSVIIRSLFQMLCTKLPIIIILNSINFYQLLLGITYYTYVLLGNLLKAPSLAYDLFSPFPFTTAV